MNRISPTPFEPAGGPWVFSAETRERVHAFRQAHEELSGWSDEAVMTAWVTFTRSSSVQQYRRIPLERDFAFLEFLGSTTNNNNTKGAERVVAEPRTAGRNEPPMPFHQAREFARSLGLRTADDWLRYCTGGYSKLPARPENLPVAVSKVSAYAPFWKGWADWLSAPSAENPAIHDVVPAELASLPDEVLGWFKEFKRVNGRDPIVLRRTDNRFLLLTETGGAESVWTIREFARATKVLRRRK